MADFLMERRQMAAKIESVAGTAETLTASEATLEVYEPRYQPQIEMHERRPASEYHGKLASIPGMEPGQIRFRAPLKGSGNVANAPALGPLLRACGMQQSEVKSIAIGAITSGPFQDGETITGGTSGGTGRVIKDTATGASVVLYVVLSGTLQTTETITGGTSGATATTSGAPTANQGFDYHPLTASKPTVTIAVYGDGSRKRTIYGARGDVTISGQTGQPGYLEFTFQGVDGGETAVAMLSSITRETTDPPAFKAAAAIIGDFDSAVFSSFGFNANNNVTLAGGDANASKGVKLAHIVNPDPKITVNPLAELEATTGFDAALRAGTLTRFYCRWPGTAGNDCAFGARQVQVTTRGEGEQEGIETTELELDCVRASLNADGDAHFHIAIV
jgi:hypothetical protein